MKTILIIGAVVVVFLVGGSMWSKSLQDNDSSVVSENGLHWHSNLAIYVKGEKIEIPANIGIGAVHLPMHTHDEDAPQGVIHLEFSGVVRESDLMLGNFFKNWGKDMRSFGGSVRMTVNGQENIEFEQFVMHDGEDIILRFE